MKKPFNLRLPVLYASALALGILYSAVLVFFGIDGIFILVPTIIFAAVCVAAIFITGRAAKPVQFLVAVLFFFVGAVYLYCKYVLSLQSVGFCDRVVKVEGTVVSDGLTSNGNVYIVVGSLEIDGTPARGNLLAYLSEAAGDYCAKGYSVSFYSVLEEVPFISGGEVNYRAVDGVLYTCNIFGGLESTYGFSLFGEINAAFENALYGALGSETAAVCYAMLTGNSSGISRDTLSAFRYGGVAHVFAVSGLHIGLIFGVLTFIFKRVGLHRFVSAAVKILVITAYAGVCNFSPSSVRAVIMCAVTEVAHCTYSKYDGWNALSFAAIILLLINPLYLFDIGFVLSFSAVLGIILCSRQIGRLFAFLPAKLASSLSVAVSAQLFSVPASVSAFGYASLAGIFLNVILVPVFSVLYVVLFWAAVLSLIMPFAAGVLLPAACAPLELVINLIVTCGFENAIVSGSVTNWIYVPFILVCLGITDKFNCRPYVKGALVIFSVAALTVTAFPPAAGNGVEATFATGYDGGYVRFSTDSGTAVVVTSDYNGYDSDFGDIDALIVLGNDDELSALTRFEGSFARVYMRGNAIHVPDIGSLKITYSDSFEACGITFGFVGNAVVAEAEGVSVSIVKAVKGQPYGELPDGCGLSLYSYEGKSAVLFASDGKSYGLEKCGDARCVLSAGGYRFRCALPEE